MGSGEEALGGGGYGGNGNDEGGNDINDYHTRRDYNT